MNAIAFKWVPTAPANLRSIYDRCILKAGKEGVLRQIALVVPTGKTQSSATTRRLAGMKSPLGEIVSDSDDKTQIVAVDALEVLAWMTANKWCEMIEVVFVNEEAQGSCTPQH